jgi:hypothetical protein
MRSIHGPFVALTLLFASVSALAAGSHPIAGMQPSQRPFAAPAITTVDHPGAWYRFALHGVTRPYPHSLRFLEDQGNWHTPFNRPGMTGRYDIRGWHQR